MAQNPFPFVPARHPKYEPLPTAGEDFVFQIRPCISVPGKTDGLYACLPLSGGGYEWVPWLGAFDPLVVNNLHVLGDADIDDDLNVDGDAQVDGALNVDGSVDIDGSLNVDTNFVVGGTLKFTSLGGGGSQSVLVDNSGNISAGAGAPAPGTIDVLDGGVSGASAVGILNFTPAAAWGISESPSGTGLITPVFGSSANQFAEGNHTQTASTITDFTEATQDVVGAFVAGGTGITATYSDVGNSLTIASTITQYTDENARDAIGTALVGGTGITVTVNDGADTITLASTITQYTDEAAQDAVGTILTDSSTIDFTYNDGANTITAAVKAESIPLGDLSNVTTAGAADGDYLGYDSGIPGWEPQPLPDIVTTVEATNWIYQQESGIPGTGNGEFLDPRGLAVDSSGNLYIADVNNERIQKLNSSLVYQAKVGASGTGNGQFAADNGAWAVAVDASDNPWVVDRGNHRVQKFNSSLTYQSQIDGRVASSAWMNTITTGSAGSGNSNFNSPYQVALDSSGNVYIADTSNNRVKKHDNTGAYVSQFALTNATGIAVDSSGNIYVSDLSGGRVRKYNSSFVLQWTSAALTLVTQLATDGTHVFASRLVLGTVVKLLCTDGSTVATYGAIGTGNGQFTNTIGIAVDATYIYVGDGGGVDRIQKLVKATGVYNAQWGITGTGNGELKNPASLTLNTSGNVLVSDHGNSRIQRFTNTGTYQEKWSTDQSLGIAAASDVKVWVSGNTVNQLDQWEYITGQVPGSGNGNFNTPSGIDIDRTPGTIFVVDQGNNRVQYFNSSGTYTGQWGALGTGNNNFNTPTDLAVNQSTGDVYVMDAGNLRVSQFGSTGTFIRAWGGTGYADGQFIAPYSIDINDNTGNVFVTDTGRDDVQEFSSSGVFIRKFGQRGVGEGEYDLSYGLAFDQAGTHLYITDAAADRVQDFEEETTTLIATSVAFDRDDFSVGEIVPGRTFIGMSPFPLDKLSDVAIGPVWGVAPAASQVVTYDEPQAQWTNKALADLGLTLDNLSDVAISSPIVGQVPVYNATTQLWENSFAPGVIETRLSADYGASNVNTAQKVFNASTNGAATLAAATTYHMEGLYHIETTGTTSHALSLLFGGTAGLGALDYEVISQLTPVATEIVVAVSSRWTAVATAVAISNAVATASHHTIHITGTVRVNTAGTFIPQFQWSAAPGGTTTVLKDSFIRFTPLGAHTFTTSGTWT